MSTNRSASRIALALIASLAFTGTALAQRGADRAAAASHQQTTQAHQMKLAAVVGWRGADRAAAASRQQITQAHQMKLAAVVGSQATSADTSNSSANVANSVNPTVSWSFAPSANIYKGGA